MFLYGKKEIDIIKYSCGSEDTPGVDLAKADCETKKFEISAIKLSVAIARTILSYDPMDADLVLQSISSFFSIQSLIETVDLNLSLVDYKNKFREFSLSGRLGELAKALNYLYAQEVLQKNLVVDFKGFLSNRGVLKKHPYTGKSPDFIAGAIGSNQFTFLSSKASCPKKKENNLSTALKEELNQCEEGSKYFISNHIPISVENAYASGIWFSTKKMPWNSALYVANPQYSQEEAPVSDPLSMVRYHYASWFALLGYYNQVGELLANKNITLARPAESVMIGDEKFYILSQNNFLLLPNYWCTCHLLRFSKSKFGLSEKIWELLDGSHHAEEKMDFYFEPISNDDRELFTDGTLVLNN